MTILPQVGLAIVQFSYSHGPSSLPCKPVLYSATDFWTNTRPRCISLQRAHYTWKERLFLHPKRWPKTDKLDHIATEPNKQDIRP